MVYWATSSQLSGPGSVIRIWQKDSLVLLCRSTSSAYHFLLGCVGEFRGISIEDRISCDVESTLDETIRSVYREEKTTTAPSIPRTDFWNRLPREVLLRVPLKGTRG